MAVPLGSALARWLEKPFNNRKVPRKCKKIEISSGKVTEK